MDKGRFEMNNIDISSEVYKVEPTLVNPNATDEAKRLMNFLTDQYGKHIISGQTANHGYHSKEFSIIERETGKIPAILSLDFIDESASRKAREQGPDVLAHARQFHDMGGIITFMWHWNAPEPYLYDTKENPWWSGFYSEHTNIDLAAIMDGRDEQGYALLVKEMDEIALQLKELSDEQIPILWRPLHEASGTWFWWGNSGPTAYIKLWQLMYDRYVNIHKLDNLIWVWNGQAKEWYPGDDVVDIIGEDIYAGSHVYASLSERFIQAIGYTNTPKMIVLSENGTLPDPDLLLADNVLWGYFTSWNGEFVVDDFGDYSDKYTSKEMLLKVYQHEHVLTLADLPDLNQYPLP